MQYVGHQMNLGSGFVNMRVWVWPEETVQKQKAFSW